SSALIEAVSGGCAMFKRCAARLKLISSATATKCSNWRRFGIRYLRGILLIWTPYLTAVHRTMHCRHRPSTIRVRNYGEHMTVVDDSGGLSTSLLWDSQRM